MSIRKSTASESTSTQQELGSISERASRFSNLGVQTLPKQAALLSGKKLSAKILYLKELQMVSEPCGKRKEMVVLRII